MTGVYRAFVGFAVLAASLVVAPPPIRAEVPSGATWTEAWFSSSDGTKLHADVLLPARRRSSDRHPVLLHVTPYGNHSGAFATTNPTRGGPNVGPLTPLLEALHAFKHGWAVVIVDLRGFGASAGCWDFMGPGERADVVAAVNWAGRQPWSSGRVGMYGTSYDAFTSLWALAARPRALKAVVAVAGSAAMHQLLASGGVHHGYDWTAPPGYAVLNVQPGAVSDSAGYHQAWASGLEPTCVTDNQMEATSVDAASPYFRARDFRRALANVRTPTLYAHGFLDYAVKPYSGVDVLRAIRGERTWLGQWRHERPTLEVGGREGFLEEAARLLNREVARRAEPHDRSPTVAVQEGPSGRWRREAQWPPSDAGGRSMGILGSGSYVDGPMSSGEPASYDDPGFFVIHEGPGPRGAWTVSRPLKRELHLAGSPTVTVRLEGRAEVPVVADLYDVAPDGSALLVTRGASRLRENGTARIDLFPQDWRFVRGHRLALLVTGSDGQWWVPLDRTGLPVTVLGGQLRMPALKTQRSAFITGTAGIRLRAKRPIRLDEATMRSREVPAP